MPLDVNRDQEIEDLFAGALEIPEAEQPAWLEKACRSDRELLAELQSLLKAYALAPQIMNRSMLPGWMDGDLAVDFDSLAGRVLGPWRIVRLIAAGGMGAVYLGERVDDSFRMNVAIKILAIGSYHPGLLAKFRIERQVLADLDHPGIARLLDGGATEEGAPYLVMEYVDGIPLREAARDANFSFEGRLRLFVEVADAVQYAHANLVIHRDLKPGNIVLRSDGRPKLLDFGIAKVFRPPGSAGGSETVVGTAWALTPRYASPEQIRGERVTTATDIYSLGVVLYELLTGRLPYDFSGDSIGEMSQAICLAPAIPPSRLRGISEPRRFSGNLDTILLKALAKEPARRYPSAADFAADIQRHLDGEPVLARGDSAGYRLGQFARRYRGLVTGLFAVFLVLLGALLVTYSFYRDAQQSAGSARWYAYASTLAATEAAIMNHNVEEARDLLGTIDDEFNGWEYRHLSARLDRSQASWKGHDARITQLTFSRDGSRFLTTSLDSTARVWSRDSRDTLATWTFDFQVESGAFLDGQERFVVGLGDGRLMTVSQDKPKPELLGRGSWYAIIDATHDGRTVAGGFENGWVALFDVAARREIRRWKAHYRLAVPVFSPDGTLLATGGSDSTIRIWDVGTGALRSTLSGHRARVFGMAWSRDGHRLLSGARDHAVTVWNLDTGLAISTFSEHRGNPRPLAFHPDDRNVISAGSEGRVIAWDAATAGRVAEYHGFRTDVSALDIAADGEIVATGEMDGTIRFWKWGTDDIRVIELPPSGDLHPFSGLVVDPAGLRIAVAVSPRWAPGREVMWCGIDGDSMLRSYASAVSSIAFVDSTTLMAASENGGLFSFKGHPILNMGHMHSERHLQSSITSVAAQINTSVLATGDKDGMVRLWSTQAFEMISLWKAHKGIITCVKFNSAGNTLATGGQDGYIRLWTSTGDSMASFRPDDSGVAGLALHPNGNLVACTKENGAAYLWNLKSDGAPDTLFPAGDGALSITFSKDGDRVVIGNHDSMIYIFDVKRRAPLFRLHGHTARVTSVEFTPNGNTLLSAGYDGTVRVWDAPDGAITNK